MALTIKNRLIKEDILDESGNKIGELKFNPNDSRIMKKMSSLVKDFGKAVKEIDKLDKVERPNLDSISIEDFDKASEYFDAFDRATDIEIETTDKLINELSEIFGKETIELFTQGTKDAESLLPIISFIEPYVKNARQSKLDKYLDNKNDVME
ncbi:MAG TPA: hypothetical protein DDW20_05000 [Firmicutes bacterium]|nr:hypothetical protein [Bacillota bacterium]